MARDPASACGVWQAAAIRASVAPARQGGDAAEAAAGTGRAMERNMRQRLAMAGIGGLAGFSLHLLLEVASHDLLPERAALAATGFAAVFFGGWLGLIGPLPILRAALGAAGVALFATLFLLLASLRFDRIESMFDVAGSLISMLILATVPLPFLVARAQGNWRDYPVLFTAAWSLVVRMAAAWLFTGLAWGLILLSDALLSLVGVPMLGRIIESDVGPWLITGLALGIALAVVMEYSELVSPYLVLKLLRLLLPPILLVMTLFIVALPLGGFAVMFGGVSVAQTLIVMAAIAAMLVTTAIDQTDAEAVQGAPMRRATQALALILPAPGALAAWALWERVAQYGWTPDRLVGVIAAALALGYGVIYAGSVLAGRGWMARIRQGNMAMALVLLALAMLWLSPVLDATRISARDQVARYVAGRTAPADLDLYSIGRWGREGEAALAEFTRLSHEPGHEALAARLTRPGLQAPEHSTRDAAVEIAGLMQVRPAGQEAVREAIVARLSPAERRLWKTGCRTRLPDGRPGCVMVVGDFLPERAGDEALVLTLRRRGGLDLAGYALGEGRLDTLAVRSLGMGDWDDPAAVVAEILDGPPDLGPAPVNRLRMGGDSVVLMP